MSETFMGLNIAVRGLYTSQRSLSVVNHNLNNVNTPGYSRQLAEQTAERPMYIPDGSGMLGTGSKITQINRVHDDYLDFKYWSENQAKGEWSKKRVLYSELESTFNEPSESGFNAVIDKFYSSLQELSKKPDDLSVRANVKEMGIGFTKYFNGLANHFESLQSDINNEIKLNVEEINNLAKEISHINRQIYNQESTGNQANDLRDRRVVLVDKLSEFINMEAYETSYGKLPNGQEDMRFAVVVSGKALVDHFDYTKISMKQRDTKLNVEDVESLYELSWEDGNKLKVRSGKLRALLDVRDGNEGDNGSPLVRGIPYYQKELNRFVRTFARAFNEGIVDKDGDGDLDNITGHADGYKRNSNVGDSPSRVRFFTMFGPDGKPMDSNLFVNGADLVVDDPLTANNEFYDAMQAQYDKITAKNFCISEDIEVNYMDNICTADKGGEIGNTGALMELIASRHNSYMFQEGAPEDFVKTMVATVGIDTQQAQMFEMTQDTIVQQVDNRRMSVSGVSIDEEMGNLVKFQHAYNASAKMIATFGEVLDILVNRLGL